MDFADCVETIDLPKACYIIRHEMEQLTARHLTSKYPE